MNEELLVWAMPRRPLYNVRGFITKLDLAVLTVVGEESWCATRAAIAADVDCKEVRVAVVIMRRNHDSVEALVSQGTTLAHLADVGPDVSGLAGLKQMAKRHAEAICGGSVRTIEIAGYLNDDHDTVLRRTFVLVYRARVADDLAAPEQMAWVQRGQMQTVQLDVISTQVVTAVI